GKRAWGVWKGVAISPRNGRIAAQMLRIVSLIALLAVSARFTPGAEGESDLYAQAAKAFADRFYERAEQQFGAFAAQFPGSTNIPSAILLQGEALFFLRRYEAAAELLQSNLGKAGAQAGEFTFWSAEAESELGNYKRASQYYRKVVADFPQSMLRMK